MQKLEINKYGSIIGWLCNLCNGYNDILEFHCNYCRNNRDKDLLQAEISALYSRNNWSYFGTWDLDLMPTNKIDRSEEGFKKLFNSEIVLVQGMSLEALEEHIKELEDIAYESRVRLQAASNNKKNRVFKLSEEEREKLISQPDFDASERSKLELPKRERRTKADKLLENLAGLGLDDEAVKALMGKVKIDENRSASKTSDVTRVLVDRNRATFNKEERVNPSNNTQESLLAEYITLISASDWKQATMNLPALGVDGAVLESIERNCKEAELRIYEKYRTVGHIAWKTKIMQTHLVELNNGNNNMPELQVQNSGSLAKSSPEAESQIQNQKDNSEDWNPFK